MLAAMMAAGLAGQAAAGTVVNTWDGIVTLTYTDPTLDKTYPVWYQASAIDATSRWSGEVAITVRIDGIEYHGTGTGRGSVSVYDGIYGDHRSSVGESVTGVMSDGSIFKLSAAYYDWEYNPRLFARSFLSPHDTWSFGYGIDVGEGYFSITGPTLYSSNLTSITQVSNVPVPAAGLLLLSALGGAAGLNLRRKL